MVYSTLFRSVMLLAAAIALSGCAGDPTPRATAMHQGGATINSSDLA